MDAEPPMDVVGEDPWADLWFYSNPDLRGIRELTTARQRRCSTTFFNPASAMFQFFSECSRVCSVALLSCDNEIRVPPACSDSSTVTMW